MNSIVKLCSINTHGIKGNIVYIENLIKKNDIIFISEHWLLPGEKYFFAAEKHPNLPKAG